MTEKRLLRKKKKKKRKGDEVWLDKYTHTHTIFVLIITYMHALVG